MLLGFLVPGTCGPQMALLTDAGIGGEPEEIQMTDLASIRSHPIQPQVFLLNVSILPTVILFDDAISEQYSPGWTVCVAHDPSELGLGDLSGKDPVEQHIY